MFKLLIIATVAICAHAQEIRRPRQSSSRPGCPGQNEIFLPQGVAPNCDVLCSELGTPCSRIYSHAPSGCYCLPNHARNASNVCVPMSDCHILCPSFQFIDDRIVPLVMKLLSGSDIPVSEFPSLLKAIPPQTLPSLLSFLPKDLGALLSLIVKPPKDSSESPQSSKSPKSQQSSQSPQSQQSSQSSQSKQSSKSPQSSQSPQSQQSSQSSQSKQSSKSPQSSQSPQSSKSSQSSQSPQSQQSSKSSQSSQSSQSQQSQQSSQSSQSLESFMQTMMLYPSMQQSRPYVAAISSESAMSSLSPPQSYQSVSSAGSNSPLRSMLPPSRLMPSRRVCPAQSYMSMYPPMYILN